MELRTRFVAFSQMPSSAPSKRLRSSCLRYILARLPGRHPGWRFDWRELRIPFRASGFVEMLRLTVLFPTGVLCKPSRSLQSTPPFRC